MVNGMHPEIAAMERVHAYMVQVVANGTIDEVIRPSNREEVVFEVIDALGEIEYDDEDDIELLTDAINRAYTPMVSNLREILRRSR